MYKYPGIKRIIIICMCIGFWLWWVLVSVLVICFPALGLQKILSFNEWPISCSTLWGFSMLILGLIVIKIILCPFEFCVSTWTLMLSLYFCRTRIQLPMWVWMDRTVLWHVCSRLYRCNLSKWRDLSLNLKLYWVRYLKFFTQNN